MSLFVVLLFVLPIVIGVAVVGVKLMELALNRELMKSRNVARWVTLITVGLVVAAFVIYATFLLLFFDGS